MSHRLAAAALIALLATACTTDIRPARLVDDGISPEAAAEGRAWIDRMVTAHGGLSAWKAHRDVEVVFTDTWPGWLARTAAMPWPQDGQTIVMGMLLGTDDARLTFRGGPDDGLTWGVQQWQTWRQPKGGAAVFEEDGDIRFWVPTMAYFFALPFRIGEASTVAYAGDTTLDGRSHAIVYATWGSAEPQDDIDQYVLYIDRESHRLSWAHYTVRDLMLADQGAVRLGDLRTVEGIVVPFEMTMVGSVGGDDVTHVMRLQSVDFGPGHPDSHYRPDPDRRGSK